MRDFHVDKLKYGVNKKFLTIRRDSRLGGESCAKIAQIADNGSA
jgi:hypothetical protein